MENFLIVKNSTVYNSRPVKPFLLPLNYTKCDSYGEFAPFCNFANINLSLQNREWRRQNDIDNIESWVPPEVVEKYRTGGFVGYDKEGFPVRVEVLPQMDWRGE